MVAGQELGPQGQPSPSLRPWGWGQCCVLRPGPAWALPCSVMGIPQLLRGQQRFRWAKARRLWQRRPQNLRG